MHQANPHLPYCKCPDWKKFQLPGKHMIAVFTKYDRSWDDLPDRYKNSPYFCVDKDFINAKNNSQEHFLGIKIWGAGSFLIYWGG